MDDRSAERMQTIVDYYTAVDARETSIARGYLSADLEFRFANDAVHTGPDGPAEAGARLRSVITGMSHRIEEIRLDDSRSHATVELTMTYERTTGGSLTVPACVVLRFDDENKFDRYRVYVDASGLQMEETG